MTRIFLKSKLHFGRVTSTDLLYQGSVAFDPELMEIAQILPYEQIDVYNVNNGARFTTYAIDNGKMGSREICVNGAAARLAMPGDPLIIVTFAGLTEGEIKAHKPLVVLLDRENRVVKS